MMTEFLKYELLVSLLIALAMLGIERVCALYRWPRRFLWASALIASLVFPLSVALTTKPDRATVDLESIRAPWPSASGQSVPTAAAPPTGQSQPDLSVRMVRPFPSPRQHFVEMRLSLDGAIKLAWLTLSIASMSYFGFAWLRIRRKIALAASLEIDGIRVRVTDGLGPAAFGLVRPEILLPQWILEAPSPLRAIALEHERQHIAARDPALLFGGLISVVLMPWNFVLWWMVRRLRFSLEADCDARVLRTAPDTRRYAEALLAVCKHRAFAPSRSVVLTSSASWLERRIRIMLAGTSRLSRLLAASGPVWALGVLAAAVLLHAPGLAAPGELRKLPPDDTKPGTERVRNIARTRFPEIFDPSFKGMAQLIMVLNRDGSVVKVREHVFTPDELPRARLDGIAKDAALDLDDSDILYGDIVDIRPPNREGFEHALGYIEYAVLKWPHDPMRAESRVRAAVEAYYPELRKPVSRNGIPCTHLIAVLMNDDGSLRQAHKEEVGCYVGDSFSGNEENKLNDFGVAKDSLGRGGEFGFASESGQPVTVRYTWPRHADDPRDVVELTRGQVNQSLWQQNQPRQDTSDDAAIIGRYFPDIQAHGRADLIKRIEGQNYRLIPWILFGRDGHIWQTGRSLAMMDDDNGYAIGGSLLREIEAHFPGIRINGAQVETLRAHDVLIQSFWISPDSPVQKMSDVVLGRRKDLLVTADFVQESRVATPNSLAHQPLIMSWAQSLNFGVPAGIGLAQEFLDLTGHSNSPVTTRLIATEAGPEAVDLELQTRGDLTPSLSQPPSDVWVRAGNIRVRYGSSGTVNLFGTYIDPPVRVQIVLRPQLLRDHADPP